jgi:uncharacterized protein YciI
MRLFLISTVLLAFAGCAAAQAAGSLFIFIYRQGPAWKVGAPMREQPGMAAHGAYMKRLFDEGRIFAAGPTTDAPGGLVIVRASALDEAKALMAADPSVTSGMFTGEIHGWTPVFRSDKPLPSASTGN